MHRLYVRIGAGVVLAIVVGWIAVGLLVAQFRGGLELRPPDQMFRSALRWVASRLDEAPQAQWPERLAEVRRDLRIPLEIVAADALPPGVARNVSGDTPALARLGPDAPSIYMPLHAGSHFLVVGPPQPPPIWPPVVGGLVFVLVLTSTASAAVGIPLVRRLRSLQNAIGELGGGNWAVRLDANAEGALSDLADSLNRTAAQVQRQFQEREALLQAVSHEMGTPLSRMRFQVELLEDDLVLPEHRGRLRALSDDLDELDELSTELVGWMETDAIATAHDFEVGPVLESLVELECEATGERLRVDLTVPAGITLRADQRQFQRAIENLLRNARRYAQERIAIDVRAEAATVVVDVRDDGPGIPPDQWERVLEPFVRIEGSRSGAHRGLGLGLAIVRRIVETHGGKVTVTSAAEGGTRVQTIWPVSLQRFPCVNS